MNNLEAFFSSNFEALQYAIFFGAMVILAFIEAIPSRNGVDRPDRKARWPVNIGLTSLNILIIGAIPVSGLFVAKWAQDESWGLLNILDIGVVPAIAIGFLLRSLVSWVIHLLMHKVPFLWRVHRIHHTDRYLDISTTVRFHPFEFLINTPIVLVAVLALGISPLTVILYELFDAFMAVFTHGKIRLPRRLEILARWIVVTPEMHRVHHSVLQPETDSNYGATLSLWDHLFRTYRRKTGKQLDSMMLGLTECQDNRSNSILWLLTLPMLAQRIDRVKSEEHRELIL